MALYETAMVECVKLTKATAGDSLGGFTTEWTEGERFKAAFVFDGSTSARVAAVQGVTDNYTITVKRSTSLQFHDVFRRLTDGKVFRVTSNGQDRLTPPIATLDMRQVSAEPYELPN